MAEELKDLIAKIQEEGVKAALDKAKSIEEEAVKKAKAILEKAEQDAENIVREAKENAARMERSGKDSLKQGARDLILSLRKEINALLDKIIVSHVREALTAHELAKIISLAVKTPKIEGEGITISLNKNDLEKIEDSLFKELKDEIKKGVTLKSSEDIRGGFIISYDKEKSYYDFTDKALADYIALYLKPRLAEMLKTEVKTPLERARPF